MRRIYPQIPDSWQCEVIGCLIESEDSDELGIDMLEVVLPSGVLVTAGWSSEGDPDGCYAVEATYGLQHLIPTITTDDADVAIQDIERLADQFRKSIVPHSDSENVYENATQQSSLMI